MNENLLKRSIPNKNLQVNFIWKHEYKVIAINLISILFERSCIWEVLGAWVKNNQVLHLCKPIHHTQLPSEPLDLAYICRFLMFSIGQIFSVVLTFPKHITSHGSSNNGYYFEFHFNQNVPPPRRLHCLLNPNASPFLYVINYDGS